MGVCVHEEKPKICASHLIIQKSIPDFQMDSWLLSGLGFAASISILLQFSSINYKVHKQDCAVLLFETLYSWSSCWLHATDFLLFVALYKGRSPVFCIDSFYWADFSRRQNHSLNTLTNCSLLRVFGLSCYSLGPRVSPLHGHSMNGSADRNISDREVLYNN